MRRRKVAVKVNDLMQQGYVYYLTEPAGKNFHPDFKPELTPKEMLELGVFGGKYMTEGVLTTSGRSNVGARCAVTSRKSRRTVRRVR